MPRPRRQPARHTSKAAPAALRIPADRDEPMLTAPTEAQGQVQTRPEPRPSQRPDDPRARAAARAAQLRDHGAVNEEATDEFYIAPSEIPDGWDYEWKREAVYGASDPAYEVATRRAGWEPVDASRHPSYMPQGAHGPIRRKGLVLMERPKEISDEAKARELRKARLQVRAKEEQLSAAPNGQFERQKSDGTPLASVKKSFEHIPIPQE